MINLDLTIHSAFKIILQNNDCLRQVENMINLDLTIHSAFKIILQNNDCLRQVENMINLDLTILHMKTKMY
jgi:hypothetical protein